MIDIPLVVVEEHHEAFFVWNYAVSAGWIPSEKNHLLHVDEHADLSIAKYETPVPAGGSVKEAYEFTYRELNIASFLYPAIYQGLFHHITWLRPEDSNRTVSSSSVQVLTQQNGRLVLAPQTISLTHARQSIPFRITRVTPADPAEYPERVVLDIDLDYFSCNDESGEYAELEITKAAYDAFRANRYHKARLLWTGVAGVTEREGRYYLHTGPKPSPSRSPQNRQESSKRIGMFLSYLDSRNIVPSLIDICRSRFSGYTPEEEWRFLEETLISQLRQRFPICEVPFLSIRPDSSF